MRLSQNLELKKKFNFCDKKALLLTFQLVFSKNAQMDVQKTFRCIFPLKARMGGGGQNPSTPTHFKGGLLPRIFLKKNTVMVNQLNQKRTKVAITILQTP